MSLFFINGNFTEYLNFLINFFIIKKRRHSMSKFRFLKITQILTLFK